MRFAGIHAFSVLAFAVEVCEGDVEAVDVRWDDGQEEEDAVEDDVFVETGEQEDGEGWEEDVEEADYQTFDHGGLGSV